MENLTRFQLWTLGNMARFPLWTAATLFAFPSYHSRSIIMGAGVFFCDPVFFYVSVLLSLFTARALESVHCGLWSFKQTYFQFSTKVCIWQSNKSQLNSIPMFPIFSRRSPISMLTLMRWGSRRSCSRRWRFGRDVELHSGLEQMHFKGTSATSKWQ